MRNLLLTISSILCLASLPLAVNAGNSNNHSASPVMLQYDLVGGANGHVVDLISQSVKVATPTMVKSIKAQEKTYTVQCNYIYNVDSLRTSGFYAFGRNGVSKGKDASKSKAKTEILKLPAGNYDLMAKFRRFDANSMTSNAGYALVFIEGVEVDRDTVLNFDASTASNHLAFRSVMPSGERIAVDVQTYDDGGKLYTVTPGNMDNIFIRSFIFHDDLGCLTYGFANTSDSKVVPTKAYPQYFDGELNTDFYVNNVSQKYIFEQQRMGFGKDGKVYSITLRSRGVDRLLVENAPDDYLPQPLEPQFAAQPLSDGNDAYGACQRIVINGNVFGISSMITDVNPRMHHVMYCPPSASTPVDWIQEGMDFRLYTAMNDKPYGVNTPIFLFSPNGLKAELEIPSLYMQNGPDGTDLAVYPGPEALTYDFNGTDLQFNQSCPIIAGSYVDYNYWGHVAPMPIFYYIGMLGENREADNLTAQVTIMRNGELSYKGVNNLTDWTNKMLQADPGKWHYNMTFVNDNGSIDGVPFHSTMVQDFDQTRADGSAPMMTAMQLRNSNGIVTNCFNSPVDAHLIIMGGDFNQVDGDFNEELDQPTIWFERADAALDVQYSPNGANDYKPIAMTENSQLSSPTSYGKCYEANLNDIDRTSANGWFDLKVKFTDAAGNYQEQTISPAFHIASLSGIEPVTQYLSSDRKVEAIYDLTGHCLQKPVSGINIIRYTDGFVAKMHF